MNRSLKGLAIAAFALAGAFGATAAQASAANFNVNFAIKNADPSASMIRTSALPSTISGLPAAAAILPGAFDPGSGNAVYSDALPSIGQFTQTSLTYANAGDLSSPCVFTFKVSRDGNVLPYLLHITASNSSCTAPADVRTSNGQFTSQVFVPTWAI